jgi:hypothetical protein
MTEELSPETLRLLRNRDARPEIAPGAHADALLRRHVLAQIADAMRGEHITAMLVKGAALALTVYPDAAARRMSDIDMLVAEADQESAVRALERLGWLVARSETRVPRAWDTGPSYARWSGAGWSPVAAYNEYPAGFAARQ